MRPKGEAQDAPSQPARVQRGQGLLAIEPGMEDSYRNRLVLSYSVRDTRIFSEQIAQYNLTQGTPGACSASDSSPGMSPWVTVGDPGLGTNVGTVTGRRL